MERGCNIHVLEYFDKLPRKMFKLKTKLVIVKINALAKNYYMHNLYMINEEYFKFIFLHIQKYYLILISVLIITIRRLCFGCVCISVS